MPESDHEIYGRTPIGRLFVRIAVPGMVSGLVWALCSIVDGMFVGNFLGSDALAAVSLAWPVLTIMMAVSDMMAAGSSVRISMSLGRGDRDRADLLFSAAVRTIVLISLVFLAVGVLLGDAMVSAMGAEGYVADAAADYIATFSLLAPAGLLFFAMDNYLRICGAVRLSMYINIGVTLLNILLLAVLIGWLGLDAWAGALATSLSMCAGTAVSLIPFLRGRTVLRFVRGSPGVRSIGRMAYNGISTFFNSVSGSLFSIVANAVLLTVAGDDGVSAYGVIMYVNSVMFSLFTGMSAAVQPALSYNHGSGDGLRVRRMTFVMSAASLSMGAVVAALCILADGPLTGVFLRGEDADVAAMAAVGLSVFALTYLFSWAAQMSNQVLAAVDMPAPALAVGVLSQAVIPVALLLPMSSLGLEGIWWSMVLASVVSAGVAAVALSYGRRKGVFRMHPPAGSVAGRGIPRVRGTRR